MIGDSFKFPPPQENVKIPGSINNCEIMGTVHFHFRYGGSGPPSLDWSPLFGYSGNFRIQALEEQSKILEEAAKDSKVFVLVTHGGVSEPFWFELFKGALISAKKHKIKLRILYPKKYGDLVEQRKILEAIVAEESAFAIATTIPDPDSFLPILREAQQKDIQIITFCPKTKVKGKLVKLPFPSIGSDLFKVGQNIALRAVQSNRLQNKVVILSRLKGTGDFDLCYQGINNVLKDYKIQADKLIIATDNPNPRITFSNYLKENNVSGIFALKGSIMDAVKEPFIEYVHSQKKPIFTCAFDKTTANIELLQENLLDTLIHFKPFLQGFLSMILPPRDRVINPQILISEQYKKSRAVKKNFGYNVMPSKKTKTSPAS